jgi:DNA-binding NarL/FixJ family response regulator
MNRAARCGLGSRIGVHFSGFIAAEGVNEARELFARKVLGRLDTSVQQTLLNSPRGHVPVEMVSVPIRDGSEVIGVFTLVKTETPGRDAKRKFRPAPRLTPRQHEVLRLLTHGFSTTQIAETLQIAEETARNHIRLLLNELGVHTRLEAVVKAFRNDWL